MGNNNKRLKVNKDLEIGGCKIFNPIDGRLDEIIEYFVGFYGEKYRPQISERINNTKFFFLPKKLDDLILTSLECQFEKDHGFDEPFLGSTVLYCLDTYGRYTVRTPEDQKRLELVQSPEGQNFYRNCMTLMEMLENIDVICDDFREKKLFKKAVDDVIKSSSIPKELLDGYSETLCTVFEQRDNLDSAQLAPLTKKDLLQLVKYWLKNNENCNKYNGCDSLEDYLSRGFLDEIFTETFIKKYEQISHEKEELFRNEAGLEITQQIQQLKLEDEQAPYLGIVKYLFTKGDANPFNVSGIDLSQKLKNIIVCPSGLKFNIKILIHEINHSVGSTITSISDQRYDTKSGFGTMSTKREVLKINKDENASRGADFEFPHYNWKSIRALNESFNDYIAEQIASKMEKDGFSVGVFPTYENTSVYQDTFELVGDFYDENMDILLEAEMSNDPLIMEKILGENEYFGLTKLVYAYMYPYKVAMEQGSIYEGKTQESIREMVSDEFEILRPMLEEKIAEYRKSKGKSMTTCEDEQQCEC